MSKDHLKSFVKAVNADQGLQQKVRAASTPDEYVDLAVSVSVPMTKESLHAATQELNEDDLQEMAGGWFGSHLWHDIKHDTDHFLHVLNPVNPAGIVQDPGSYIASL